jgi:molybdate transport system substrate-binding protein
MTTLAHRVPLALLAAVGLALAGCSSGASGDAGVSSSSPVDAATSTAAPASQAPATSTVPALSGDLVVFAAASLQDTFTQLGDELMAANPDLKVRFNFGSSGTLTQQLLAGAPADVYASANTKTMTDAAPVVGDSRLFTHNSLVIVVPAGNPGGVAGLADFTNAGLKLALCDESAPCGTAAKKVFDNAGLTAAPDTYGQDVKATLALVTGGEVDAALVYKTDAIAAGDAVETITFPEAADVINDYPIATTKDATNPQAASAFVDFVLSAAGQKVLTDAGFDPAS